MNGYARLIDYGTCKPVNESVEKTNNSPTGYFLEADNLIFTERVDKICLKKGMVFGISYHFVSSQSTFSSRIIYPLLINKVIGACYKETTEEKHLSPNGLNFDYYRLEHDWEMIPGKWTFQVEQSGNVLLEKSFDLYRR